MNGYDTSTLLAVRKRQDFFTPFLLMLFFPNVVNSDDEYIDLDELQIDEGIAPLVSPMVAGKVDKTKQQVMRRIKPAYLKPKDVIKPNHMIKRRAGEQVGGIMTPSQRRDAVVVDLLGKQEKKITRREEEMVAQAMLTGRVVLEDDDYPRAEVDFGRAAANTIVLAGTDVWTDVANANPLDQFEEWNAISESPITDIVMNSVTWRLLTKFQSVLDLLDKTKGLSQSSGLELGPDNSKWASFKGFLGTMKIWVYDGFYVNGVGAKVKYVPDNKVVWGSSAIDGVMGYAAILDKSAGYQPLRRFPKIWEQEDPAFEFLMTQASVIPIPVGTNSSGCTTVA